MKNTVITKLSSRKFWASFIAFASSLLTVIFSDRLSAEEIELIKNGIFILCVYIFGESGIDIVRLLRTSFEYGEAISGFSDGSEITPDDEDLTDTVTAVEETK
ncbi:MAG: hypothetical protein E7665_05510 [Ruminococcaceae bacterium]|nr:hypothetical protein [Oscillospiraceae bacterium]